MTREEFKACFDQMFDEIRNYIAYRCGDAELASDIAQEAFMCLWEKQQAYRGAETRGLLYKMASNLWVSKYRKGRSAQRYRLSLAFKPGSNTTEEAMEYEELKAQYEEALAGLSEKQRAVFLMSRMEQLTYREIAERLDISVKAVEKRMHSALGELRKILAYEQ